MCKIAKQVFADNSIEVSKINLINQSSREYKGEDLNVETPVNLVVSEIFDTELIGEGCLETFIHAASNLVHQPTPPVMVPWGATVYAVPIKSHFIESFLDVNSDFIWSCDELSKCRGLASPFEIQFSCIENYENKFAQFCDPVSMFHFNFEKLSKSSLRETVVKKFTSNYKGTIGAVLMFWSLHMDHGDLSLDISNVPKLLKNVSSSLPNIHQWREHWVQAVYPVKHVDANAGSGYFLRGFHNDYTFWFEIEAETLEPSGDTDNKMHSVLNEPPVCTCGVHVSLNRNRIHMMNHRKYEHLLKSALTSLPNLTSKSVLLAGNFSLPILKVVLELNISEIICEESNSMCLRTLRKLVKNHSARNRVQIVSSIGENTKVDLILGEPFYMSSLLPWHHAFVFLEICRKLRLRDKDVTPFPSRGCIKCALIRTTHLHRLRASVGKVHGVNLEAFNKVVIPMNHKCFINLESQYLFQYETYLISQPILLMHFDFCAFENTNSSHNLQRDLLFASDFRIKTGRKIEECNAVVFWMEYKFDTHSSDPENYDFSEGLLYKDVSKKGDAIAHWSPGHKQAICFIDMRFHKGLSIIIDKLNSEVKLIEL